MKTFNEFVKTIDTRKLEDIASNAVDIHFEDRDITPLELPAVAVNASLQATMYLMEKYHEWLAEQIER